MNVSTRTPGPFGRPEARDQPGRRAEVVLRVLGVQPDLDRVPAPRRPAGDRELLAGGDAQLLAHDVDARAELRHGMLDLKARVQLDEVEAPVGAEQELEGACVAIADGAARTLGGSLHLLAGLGRQRSRRRLLDQLLVAALDRAFALAERQHVAVVVADDLDLDVARRRRPPSRRRAVGSPKAACASAAAAPNASSTSSGA